MEKISKSQVKLIKSLQIKKFRNELGLFVAEGEKCVAELRKRFELVYYIQTDLRADRTQTAEKPLPDLPLKRQEYMTLLATPAEIEQMSGLKTPQGVIGVFKKPAVQVDLSPATSDKTQTAGDYREDLILVLDGIQDPGNLGTIIRTCDWFGVHDIFCSSDTADCYNPKVVQATMGALARVHIHYVDLPKWLEKSAPSQKGRGHIYGTLLDGKDMYEVLGNGSLINGDASLNDGMRKDVIIMGNEGNGISPAVRKLITHPIRIPSYPKNAETSESLNVSIATAIVLAEFRRARVN